MKRRADYEELHEQILSVAKQFFLEKGIVYTEMKDIADRLGIVRSTLYRHFRNKESILFELTEQILSDVMDIRTEAGDKAFQSGMDEFDFLARITLDRIVSKSDEIVFLRDFDVYFTQGYPEIESAERYVSFASNLENERLIDAVRRGMEDGSIRDMGDPAFIATTVLHSILAMAQRVLPRKEHFIRESKGHSIDYLYSNLEILLSGMRSSR